MADFRTWLDAYENGKADLSTLPVVLKVEEVAALLRVSKQVVYRMIEDNGIESVRIGHQIRIPSESVRALLGGNRTQQEKRATIPTLRAQEAHA